MTTGSHKPKLRWPLDLQVTEHRGEKFIILRDRAGISEQPAVVPTPLMPIITLFDGQKTIDQIAAATAGQGVTVDHVLRLAAELDAHFLLENERSQNRWIEIQDNYRSLPIRPAAFAGAVYPADPGELKRALDEFVAHAAPVPRERLSRTDRMVALASPHIDYRRGWQTYAAAGMALAHAPAPDIIFLIGTNHQASRGIFHLSRKGFETPLGRINPAAEVIEDLSRLFGTERSFAEEILHRSEHSLELQVPFLQRRFRAEIDTSDRPLVVPILVGSFHQYLLDGKHPAEHGEGRDFIGAWVEVIKSLVDSGKRILVHAGIDLAHVGKHFGDINRLSDSGLPQIESRDRELLDAVLAADEKKLFEHIAEDLDARRICGFPSMYTTLAALKKSGMNLRGDLIEYRQAVDPATDCIVTFASAYWSTVN